MHSDIQDGTLEYLGLPVVGVPMAYLYANHFAELSIHKPHEGFLLSLLATLLSPVRWIYSKFVETHLKRKLALTKFGMVPDHSFLQELNSCLISTVPEDFYNRVEKGSIRMKKAPNRVILATGFRGVEKIKNIFVSPTFQDLIAGSTDKTVPLYSRWVAELLDGTFKLRKVEEMETDAVEWDKYMKQYSDNTTGDLAWMPFISGTMIRSARTLDGTQSERKDALQSCLCLTAR
ncbi:hypothetical protein Acr_14g0000210 [Actinidia rufa]|uniref:Uncharacterized protein n=1 Tax=Actinidia rufa TaxID=165716 RepID=A0A7J0FNV0_9ERIC|nr:hypothetical protein Acr_14g0000210 [Actinidia rufa]